MRSNEEWRFHKKKANDRNSKSGLVSFKASVCRSKHGKPHFIEALDKIILEMEKKFITLRNLNPRFYGQKEEHLYLIISLIYTKKFESFPPPMHSNGSGYDCFTTKISERLDGCLLLVAKKIKFLYSV